MAPVAPVAPVVLVALAVLAAQASRLRRVTRAMPVGIRLWATTAAARRRRRPTTTRDRRRHRARTIRATRGIRGTGSCGPKMIMGGTAKRGMVAFAT